MKDTSPCIGSKHPKSRRFLANDPIRIKTRMDARSGEKRVLELGRANAGRALFVAWTPRGVLMRPVTAFDANHKTRSAYQRKRNEEKQ
jgi:uncharacterized DUF497 family protein